MMEAGALKGQNKEMTAKIHHFKVFQGLRVGKNENTADNIRNITV